MNGQVKSIYGPRVLSMSNAKCPFNQEDTGL